MITKNDIFWADEDTPEPCRVIECSKVANELSEMLDGESLNNIGAINRLLENLEELERILRGIK